jgi:hypothetical protein
MAESARLAATDAVHARTVTAPQQIALQPSPNRVRCDTQHTDDISCEINNDNALTSLDKLVYLLREQTLHTSELVRENMLSS